MLVFVAALYGINFVYFMVLTEQFLLLSFRVLGFNIEVSN